MTNRKRGIVPSQSNKIKEQSPTVRRRRIFKTIFCALSLVSIGHPQQTAPPAQQTGSLPAPRPGFSFPQKQTLTYTVDWRVFSAGTAVIRFEQVGDREKLSADADTSGAINLLFHASDRFQSNFDREKGCTYEFDKQTVEGGGA